MHTENIIQAQLSYYRKGKAGCAFVAVAAKDPTKYGWQQIVIDPEYSKMDQAISFAIDSPNVTTLSLIFPNVNCLASFAHYIQELQMSEHIKIGQNIIYDDHSCLGFRVTVGESLSWVSGFGNFDFLPETRRTPYTEITFRVKPRPDYKWVMKKSPPNTIHLADLDMLGIGKPAFTKLWQNSLDQTERILEHKPDLKSAAKTTYAIPVRLNII